MMKLRRSLGFTLIELIVIIGILGSITAVAAPNILGAQDNAEELACQDQMDFILQGFQNEQLYPDSSYAFTEVTASDGVAQLDIYIGKAEHDSDYIEINFEDQVACPSGDTRYEAAILDDRLYVYCPVHDVYSHIGLRGRAPKTDPTVYDTGAGWTGRDDNWIIGDHENFMAMPLEDQYYHMEIGFQMIKYDDGDGINTMSYDYDRNMPEYFLEIPTKDTVSPGSTAYYTVNESRDPITNRVNFYDLDQYNGTNDELTFAMAIDYQETEGGLNFTSNSLQIKNVNSNALDKMDLDIMKESDFDPEETTPVTHQRDMFDNKLDWILIDVVPQEGNTGDKTMYIHMQQADDTFVQLFHESVPVASDGKVQFAFFVGKRVEGHGNDSNNGVYYPHAYPTPIQVFVKEYKVCSLDDGPDDRTYEQWARDFEYEGYETYLPDTSPPPPYDGEE